MGSNMNSIYGVDEDAFMSSIDSVFSIDDNNSIVITQARTEFHLVISCIRFLDKLSTHASPLSLLHKSENRNVSMNQLLTSFGREFLKCARKVTTVNISSGVFLYNPKVSFFANFINRYNMVDELAFLHRNPERESVLLGYIDELREHLNSKEMHSLIKNFQRGPAKNYKALVNYTHTLFKHYARLLVIRIDLSFLDMYKKEVSLKDCALYRRKLLGDRRSRPFIKNAVGYAWSLEYARSTGYHYHMLFFYDGSKHREDITIGMGIGEQWKDITGNKGRFYLCNTKKDSYRFCGIGMVDYHDGIARQNLNKAIAYLTKPQHFAKVRGLQDARVRAFGRGDVPHVSPLKGRPRRKVDGIGKLE